MMRSPSVRAGRREAGTGSGSSDSLFTSGEARQARRLSIALALASTFFVFELAGAIVAESVVLQAEAIHLFTDVLALSGSLLAMRIAVRRPTPRFTYGLRRVEPVAALISAGFVLVSTAGILFEGMSALRDRHPPHAGLMLAVAIAALVVNGTSAWLLHGALFSEHRGGGHSRARADRPAGASTGNPANVALAGHSLNLRGAWLHALGDALGAIAALVAALVVRSCGSTIADPVGAFAVAAILVVGAAGLLRDAGLVFLEAAPAHLPVETIRDLVLAFPGVTAVHELHAWALGAGHDAVTVHVRAIGTDLALGRRIAASLRHALGVEYVTVQVEPTGREFPDDEGEYDSSTNA
ncbi:MAG: cation diffusion facilitator family transporter [Polyangiaceae bacterium]|jgi:cation diffusion facilitator family transporter